MSVVVDQVSKLYGKQKAVDAISFQAKKGEILGFLGPNGAGKTTTMKILTCFLNQTYGKATVCGFDTIEDPIEVRRNIGYLPEHNPLHKEMYVKEYLRFVGGMYKVNNIKSRIAEVIEMTGLGKEQHKHIGALSKGYRQRVGLAQALIHDPEVLILDEPTSGLDPNQLKDIRELIKEVGKEKTVIFSTHIMQEVQALCDRVIIINNGKLVADDSIDTLQMDAGEQAIITIEIPQSFSFNDLGKIQGVTTVKNLGANKYQILGSNERDFRTDIFNFVVANKLTLLEMKRDVKSVEDVFQELTKKN